MSELHDLPNARQLVESVREWLERDVLAATNGRVQFHARVAINVLAMVERELELGSAQAREHDDRLRSLGVFSDVELADAIRNGVLDERLAEVVESVRADVIAKLMVANPNHLIPEHRDRD